MSDKKVYEVGYGKPPKNTRFQKGKSGNPKGRPKKEKSFSYLTAESLFQTFVDQGAKEIKVRENDGKALMSQLEGVVARLYQQAMAGNMSAMKILLSTLEKGSISFGEMLNKALEMSLDQEIKDWDKIGNTPSETIDLNDLAAVFRFRKARRNILGEKEIPYLDGEPRTTEDWAEFKEIVERANRER